MPETMTLQIMNVVLVAIVAAGILTMTVVVVALFRDRKNKPDKPDDSS